MGAVATLLGELAKQIATLIAIELQGRGLGFVLVMVDPETHHHVVRSNLDVVDADSVLREVRERMVQTRVTLPDNERG